MDAAIVEVSIPPNSQSPYCRPYIDNVWDISAPPLPFNVTSGIGIILNPNVIGGNTYQDFALHLDLLSPAPSYLAANVPNPDFATVTYKFDSPTSVAGVEIVQHVNGITKVEGLAGDSLAAMTSLGAVFGPSGDVISGFVSSEAASQSFFFNSSGPAATIFQLIVRKTVYPNAFACYRIYPLDSSGQRIPVIASTQPPGQTIGVIEVSIPAHTQSPYSRPFMDDIWDVAAPPFPLNDDLGIGIILNHYRPTGN